MLGSVGDQVDTYRCIQPVASQGSVFGNSFAIFAVVTKQPCPQESL